MGFQDPQVYDVVIVDQAAVALRTGLHCLSEAFELFHIFCHILHPCLAIAVLLEFKSWHDWTTNLETVYNREPVVVVP